MFPIFKAYLELTKPRILSLVLVTMSLGFYLGSKAIISWPLLCFLLLGAGLVCAGSSALNHSLEWESDAQMTRTQNRPIPSGIITPSAALNFGIILILAGLIILYAKVNLLTAFLSLLTAFLYILVYTPMKKITWLNTTIGAIPGALPPLGGWSAATGNVELGGWVLFFILFIWQHPHFYSIAWMFKEDYKKAGFKMLPSIDPEGRRTFFQILLFSLILIPVSVLPTIMGMSGLLYGIGALLASLNLFWIGRKLAFLKSHQAARKLLRATVFYLPFLFILILLDIK